MYGYRWLIKGKMSLISNKDFHEVNEKVYHYLYSWKMDTETLKLSEDTHDMLKENL